MCWLIRRKALVRIPGQVSKRNMKKLSLLLTSNGCDLCDRYCVGLFEVKHGIVEKRTVIKRSHSVPSQYYTADDSSNRCFRCSMHLFEPMCESSHCRREERSVFGGWFS